MEWEKKSFDVGLNGDDSLTRLQPGEYFNAFNMRGGTSERGHVSGLQAVPGTTLLANALPAGTNIFNGGCEDEGTSRIVWANWNSNGDHALYCYDIGANVINPVLLNSQVAGGLNLDRYHFIHSCFIVNRTFYWTDGLNEPRRINIDYAMELGINTANPVPGFHPIPGYSKTGALPKTSIVTGGFLYNTYTLPANPAPSYASGILECYYVLTGTAGPNKGPTPTDFFFKPNRWANYGVQSAAQIIATGLDLWLQGFDPTKANYSVSWVAPYTVTVKIKLTWDFGFGDGQFAPVTSFDLQLSNYVRDDGLPTNPYTAPLSQANIAWIRRPPAIPPIQQKILESPVPTSNFIGDQAFQLAWRVQYKGLELSTLSPLSTTAAFNEQDPPPTETSLNIPNNNIVQRGYLATNIVLPAAPTPAYGTGVFMKITRVGSGSGPNAGAEDIPIPLNWAGYPATRSYSRVIVEGLAAYFAALPGSDNDGALTTGNLPVSVGNTNSKWYISSRDAVHPTLNIKETWDWGLGDSTFPPTTSANVTLYTQTNAVSRQYSRIDVELPLSEPIDQDVIQVDLVANYLVSGLYTIIKSWKTSNPFDVLAIAAHNNGSTPLTYQFYNNQVGIALDSAYSVKPNDSVPISAGTIEVAKNRGFMGNYKLGYNSSNLSTSLRVSQVLTTLGTSAITSIQGEWYAIRYFGGALGLRGLVTSYIIQTTVPASGQPPGSPYYYYTVANAATPLPISIASGLIYLGTNISQVLNYYGGLSLENMVDQGVSVAILPEAPSANYGVIAKAFKTNSFYQVSVSFLDNYQRKGGIVTNDALRVTIPNTGFSANQYVTALNWFLDNSNAAFEIPVEAFYYSINITKCLRTRFFEQAIGFMSYCTIDEAGTLAFTSYLYDPNLHGVAIDISFLTSNGMGYTYNAGDICSFFLNGQYYSLAIIGTSGNFLICALQDIGILGSLAFSKYEIYTPYKQQANEPYFEVAEIYPVSNPGTAARQYSVTSGAIAGDVFVFQRSNNGVLYVAEAMSPNNKYYMQWITDAGRPNFVDSIGQVNKTMSTAFSNTFIQGSQVNGLSTFDALDTQDLSQEFGDLQKLILASKIQKEGTVMLAICVRETVSLYLGETQVAAPQGNAFLAISSGVIGTIYPLKGSFGTINPESAKRLHGDVFWIDVNNGGPIQYSDNGLELITKKLHTFWRRWCAAYKTLTPAQIVALGSQPFIIGGVDKFNGELLWTIPQLLAANPAGALPGYTTGAPPNLFNIFDGQAKTMVYKVKDTRWMPACSYAAEGLIDVGNQLFGYKGGNLYLMNDTTALVNTFFGVAYAGMVMFAPTDLPDLPKLLQAINVESDVQPTSMIIHSYYPNEQLTDIVSTDWKNKEGVYYVSLRRDRLSPGFTDPIKARISGDKIIGKAPSIQLNFGVDIPAGVITPVYFHLKYVNIGYQASGGHHTMPSK